MLLRMTGQTSPPNRRILVIFNPKSGSGDNTVLICAAHLRAARRFAGEQGMPLSCAAAIAEIRERLAAAGRNRVIRVKLARPPEPVHIVKIIVPSLRDIRDVQVTAPQRESIPA